MAGRPTKDDVKAIFKKFDLNGDGFITREELGIVLNALDVDFDDEKFEDLLTALSSGGMQTHYHEGALCVDRPDGISYDEFLDWVITDEDPLNDSIKAGPDPLKILVDLLGDKLQSQCGEVCTRTALAGKYVGLFFGAAWCPRATNFTPELVEVYKSKLQDKGLEIVCISDGDESANAEYHAMMPWLALAWEGAHWRHQYLQRMFEVGPGSLVILDTDATCITLSGRENLMDNIEGFPWRPNPEDRRRCDEIFDFFDLGKDGFLDRKEFTQLASETDLRFDPVFWPEFCGSKGVSHATGFTPVDLYKCFHRFGIGSIKTVHEILSDPIRRKRNDLVLAAIQASKFTGEQLEKIFEAYEPEKDLSKADFLALWKSFDFQEEYLEMYFTAIDENGNGVISFKELLAGLTACSRVDRQKTAELLMKVYDTDGSGFLDREEFNAALASCCKSMKAAVFTTLSSLIDVFVDAGLLPPTSDEDARQGIDMLMCDCRFPDAEDFEELFDQIDSDVDGKVTLPELKEFWPSVMLPQEAGREQALTLFASQPFCPMVKDRLSLIHSGFWNRASAHVA